MQKSYQENSQGIQKKSDKPLEHLEDNIKENYDLKDLSESKKSDPEFPNTHVTKRSDLD